MGNATVSQATLQPSGSTEPDFMTKLMAFPTAAREYFADLQAEMKRVTWPTWKQVRATTTVVIASIFAFAFYFGLVDSLVNKLIEKIFATLAK